MLIQGCSIADKQRKLNARERQIKLVHQMGKRRMWELVQLKDQMILPPLFLPRKHDNSMLMPLRTASSVPRAGLRDKRLAHTNQPHGAAEPSMVLLTSEMKNTWQCPFTAFH